MPVSQAERSKSWYLRNKDKVNQRRSTPEAKAKASEANRRYYQKNKDKIRARHKEWAKRNPEKMKGYKQTCKKYVPSAKTRNYQKEYMTEYRHNKFAKHRISRKRAHAKSLGVEFSLTVEWFEENFRRGCAVTGIEFSVAPKSPWRPEFDRLVHKGPYTEGNCRLVCAIFNRARMGYSDEDVQLMAKSLAERAIL